MSPSENECRPVAFTSPSKTRRNGGMEKATKLTVISPRMNPKANAGKIKARGHRDSVLSNV